MPNLLVLDALLLFVLAVPVVMGYRILPIVGTPYWLFAILFVFLFGNMWISLYPSVVGKKHVLYRIKTFLLVAVLTIVVGGTLVTAIADRSHTAPVYGVHDIILQQEAAMRYFLEGKNPYKETYFGTPLESWHYAENGIEVTNPALYHFVMPPWYLVFPFVVYFFSMPVFGVFDGRMVLLLLLGLTVFVCLRWFQKKELSFIAVTLITLSPGVIDYFIEGRSDAFAFAWLVLSLYLLEKKKLIWSGIVFALAMLSKQTVWFVAPMYLVFLWVTARKSWKACVLPVVSMALTGGFLVLPFIAWDPKAFLDSVVLYLSGGTVTGYPISGYGLGMLLNQFGIIKDLHGYYPFFLWQLGLGIPAIILSIRFLAAKPVMSRVLLGYAFTLGVVWYVSRYFNNSHMAYIGTVFVLGVMKHWDEQDI